MAHFAKLDNNNIVTLVVTVNNDIATDEAAGISFFLIIDLMFQLIFYIDLF